MKRFLLAVFLFSAHFIHAQDSTFFKAIQKLKKPGDSLIVTDDLKYAIPKYYWTETPKIYFKKDTGKSLILERFYANSKMKSWEEVAISMRVDSQLSVDPETMKETWVVVPECYRRKGDFFKYDSIGHLSYKGRWGFQGAEGIWTYYYPSGAKEDEGGHNDNGQENGVWQYWFENGNLDSIATFDKGDLSGPIKKYYPSGGLIVLGNYSTIVMRTDTEMTFNPERLDDSTNPSDENYQIVVVAQEGVAKTGPWKYYDEQGNLIKTEVYNERGNLIKME